MTKTACLGTLDTQTTVPYLHSKKNPSSASEVNYET